MEKSAAFNSDLKENAEKRLNYSGESTKKAHYSQTLFLRSFYLISILILFLSVSASEAKVLVVGPNSIPDVNYTSIQLAINAASSGDTIEVHGGSYAEAITMNKSGVTLSGVDQPLIQPTKSNVNAVTFGSSISGCTIIGFTIRGGSATSQSYGNGIRLEGSGNYIYDNLIYGGSGSKYGGNGIYLIGIGSKNNRVYSNTISGGTSINNIGGSGVCITSTPSSNSIYGNTIVGGSNYGICIESAEKNSIYNNTIYGGAKSPSYSIYHAKYSGSCKSANTIYLNDFKATCYSDCPDNWASQASYTFSGRTYSNKLVGNNWFDYTGSDTSMPPDGIGDSIPYLIQGSGNNADNFPLTERLGINGTVFEDKNGNGIKDSNEPALEGWTIYIDSDNNGQKDAGEVSFITSLNGSYVLPHPSDVACTIREMPPDGSSWICTCPASAQYLVQATDTAVYIKDFGNVRPLAVSKDSDPAESTDVFNFVDDVPSSGRFNLTGGMEKIFNDIQPGTYIITESKQTGWVLTEISDIGTGATSYRNSSEGDWHDSYQDGDDQVQISLETGKFSRLTFANTKLGSITASIATAPLDPAERFSFKFVGSSGDVTSFDLDKAQTQRRFINLPPGKYIASIESGPERWELGSISCNGYSDLTSTQFRKNETDAWRETYQTGDKQIQISLSSGQNPLITFINKMRNGKTISGKVYLDNDASGGFSQNDHTLADFRIFLEGKTSDRLDIPKQSTLTDSLGFYSFSSLYPGSYTISEILPEGWINTTPISRIFDIESDRNDVDFFNLRAATVGGRVWHDQNGNGIQENDEPGLADVAMELYNCCSGHWQTRTDSNGLYSFTSLIPGDYSLKFSPSLDYIFSPKDQGSEQAKDSDVGSDGKTDLFALSSGQVSSDEDAGIYLPASITGKTWDDLNADGIRQNEEPGMNGITIILQKPNGENVSTSTANDGTGSYSFSGLNPGCGYHLVFYLPQGYLFTKKNTPEAGSKTGETEEVCLTSGQINASLDAGFIKITDVTDPLSQEACPGSRAVFETIVSGSGDLSYQWQKKKGKTFHDLNDEEGHISGVRTAKLIIDNVSPDDSGYYKLVATGAGGKVVSQNAELTVKKKTTVSDPLPQEVCAGGKASFTVSASSSGHPTYQWQKKNGDHFDNLTNINGRLSGANYYKLIINKADPEDSGDYRAAITGECGQAVSESAHLTVKDKMTITNPSSQKISVGTRAIFNITATGPGNLTYIWQKKNSTGKFNDLEDESNHIAGVASPCLVIESAVIGDSGDYRVVIAGECGQSISKSAKLTVNPIAGLAINMNGPVKAKAGEAVNYTITVTYFGTSKVSDALIRYEYPADLTSVQYAINGGDLHNCASGKAIALPEIPKNGQITVAIRGVIKSSVSDGTAITNKVTISSKAKDLNVADNQASLTTTVCRESSVVMTVDQPQSVIAGAKITFALKITNFGPSDADGVIVTDALPSCLKFRSALSTTGDKCAYYPSDNTVICRFSKELNVNDPQIITVKTSVPLSVPNGTVIPNMVCLDFSRSASLAPEHKCQTKTILVEKGIWPALVNLTKVASAGLIKPGEIVSYNISYSNPGVLPLTNVVVTENYPADMILLSANPSPDPGTNNRWTVGTLESEAGGQIKVDLKAPPPRNMNFSSRDRAEGMGFINVYKKFNTGQEPNYLKNTVVLTCAEIGPVSSEATIAVGDTPGTSLTQTEHGSGSYDRNSLIDMLSANKSLVVKSSLSASYRPISFVLPRDRVQNFTSKWFEAQNAQNQKTGAFVNERYKFASHIDKESRLDMDENKTALAFNVKFNGYGYLGAIKKYSPEAGPRSSSAFESMEDYSGSFHLNESLEEYGTEARFYKSAYGQGFTSSDKHIKGSQRTYEYGSGSYQDQEIVSTPESYIAKYIKAAYSPSSYQYVARSNYTSGPNNNHRSDNAPDFNTSLKWKDALWSYNPGISLLGEEVSGADYIEKESIASGLNDLNTRMNFSGKSRLRAELKDQIRLDEENTGKFKIQRKIHLTGVSRYDSPHLTLTKSGQIIQGTTIANYTITILNDGNSALGPIYVKDPFPIGTQFIISSTKPAEVTSSYANWTFLRLSIGQSLSINLKLNLTGEPQGMINRAYVAGGHDGRFVTASNYTTMDFNWLPCPLEQNWAFKKVRVDLGRPDVIWYRISVKNTNNIPIKARVIDNLPGGLMLLNSSIEPEPTFYNLSWLMPDIAPGQTKSVDYIAQALREGKFINSAHVEVLDPGGHILDWTDISAVTIIDSISSDSLSDWHPPDWGFDQSENVCGVCEEDGQDDTIGSSSGPSEPICASCLEVSTLEGG